MTTVLSSYLSAYLEKKENRRDDSPSLAPAQGGDFLEGKCLPLSASEAVKNSLGAKTYVLNSPLDIAESSRKKNTKRPRPRAPNSSSSIQAGNLIPPHGKASNAEGNTPKRRTEEKRPGCCRTLEAYDPIKRLGEGAYGVVHLARDIESGTLRAVKIFKNVETDEGFPRDALREIGILMTVTHQNIVQIVEVVSNCCNDEGGCLPNTAKVGLVLEKLDTDLRTFLRSKTAPLLLRNVRKLMKQLLSGIARLHKEGWIHRDIKPSNLLLSDEEEGVLKLCDFGLASGGRGFKGVRVNVHGTLGYRAPETLPTTWRYANFPVDVFAAGVVFAELLQRRPLFKSSSEDDNLARVTSLLGNVDAAATSQRVDGSSAVARHRLRQRFCMSADSSRRMITKLSSITVLDSLGLDLMVSMLNVAPQRRIRAQDALKHQWFSP
eukprot:jgi/Bigna1/55964/estExt_Genewise1Plus.C_780018